jgi:hypothetical protein
MRLVRIYFHKMKIFNAASHQVTPIEVQVFPVDVSEEGAQMTSVDCIADIYLSSENLNFDSNCLFQRWQQRLNIPQSAYASKREILRDGLCLH